MRTHSLVCFLRTVFTRRRKTLVLLGILAVAELIFLVVWHNAGKIVVFACALLVISRVLVFCDLRRHHLRYAPWPLTITALFMPQADARRYLEALASGFYELRGRQRRRHMWNAIRTAPKASLALWHCWLRAKWVALAVCALTDRVHRVQGLIESTPPGSRRHRAARRRLRLYCRLVLCATGTWQYDEIARPARALLRCRPPKGEIAELTTLTAELVRALATWRPGQV